MKEREDLSRASNHVQWSRQARFGEGLQQTEQMSAHVWVKLDSSKSDGQSLVCEISGDTRESVKNANKLDQKFDETCNDEYAEWLRTNQFSFQFRSKQGAEQTVVMVRLSEENHSGQHSRRSCLETTQRAREETTATVQANMEAWLDAFVLVSTGPHRSVEHHADMNAAQRVTE